MDIRLARLFLNIQEGTTDELDYEFLVDYLEGLTGLTKEDIEEYIYNHYEELITWQQPD